MFFPMVFHFPMGFPMVFPFSDGFSYGFPIKLPGRRSESSRLEHGFFHADPHPGNFFVTAKVGQLLWWVEVWNGIAYGIIWKKMEKDGIIWNNMESYGIIWNHMEESTQKWPRNYDTQLEIPCKIHLENKENDEKNTVTIDPKVFPRFSGSWDAP